MGTQTLNKNVYVYHLICGCGLPKSLINWDMDQACVLRTSNYMLQALGEVVERPTGVKKQKNDVSEFVRYVFAVFSVLGQYLAIQLRTAAIKINSGQRGCGVRPCGLFY